MLLYSFRNFFMLEFLLFLNFFENDIFKLSLVIKLPLFTKLNKLVLLLSYGMFAHWALQRMISSISISKPSFHIMLVIGLPPLQEARITEKMTFLLFTGTPLGLWWQITLGVKADRASRHFAVPKVIIYSWKCWTYLSRRIRILGKLGTSRAALFLW